MKELKQREPNIEADGTDEEETDEEDRKRIKIN